MPIVLSCEAGEEGTRRRRRRGGEGKPREERKEIQHSRKLSLTFPTLLCSAGPVLSRFAGGRLGDYLPPRGGKVKYRNLLGHVHVLEFVGAEGADLVAGDCLA